MARVESVQLVDDLDGGAADETVSFSLEGGQWEIDLTAAHAAQLREALAPFVGAARRSSDRAPGPAIPRLNSARVSVPTRRQTAEIRQWALANGFDLSERGRIPKAVVQAYDGRSDTGAPEPGRAEAPAPAQEPDVSQKQTATGPVDLSGLFKEASIG